MNETETKKHSQKEWPTSIGTQDALDSALEDGLKSGVSSRNPDEIFEEALAKLKNG